MTIHSSHPFQDPESGRDPARRLRGRLGGTVTLWTAYGSSTPVGLTVSSLMLAAGDPPHMLALIDPDSDLAAALGSSGAAVVQLLHWRHQQLAEAFAGQFPAPGGAFRMATWDETAWGPRLHDAQTWAGVRVVGEPAATGWSVLVDAVVEHIEVGAEDDVLIHRRGHYVRPDPS